MQIKWRTGIPHVPGMYVWRIPGREFLGLRTVAECGDLIEHGWVGHHGEGVTRGCDVAPFGKWSGTEWTRVEAVK